MTKISFKRKVIGIGNSLGITIDAEDLDSLNISKGDYIEATISSPKVEVMDVDKIERYFPSFTKKVNSFLKKHPKYQEQEVGEAILAHFMFNLSGDKEVRAELRKSVNDVLRKEIFDFYEDESIDRKISKIAKDLN